MKTSLNCIILGVTTLSDSFTVPVCDKNDINGNEVDFVDLKIGDLKYLIWKKKEGMLQIDDPDTLILWKVARGDNLKDIITEEQIKNKGEELMPIELFSNYFSNKDAVNKSLIIVQAPTTELGRKRPITEEGNPEQKRRKWETNGVITSCQRDYVYFVDPLPLSDPLLSKIRGGDYMAIHGARASGKSTRVLSVMGQLEKENYICVYITLELVNVESVEKFWSTFGYCLFDNAHAHIKDQDIKSSSEFAKLFRKDKWKSKVVLFIDEYDILDSADDAVKSSFLKAIRGIKATRQSYDIWSINAIGPFSILHLSSKEVTTSPFNVKEPFQNPNFTLEQVQIVFKEFAISERTEIDPEIINNIYMRTNGHAGLVCLCGKAIRNHLMKKRESSELVKFIKISTWLNYTASNSLEEVILGYPTFRKLVDTLVNLEKAKRAVDLLRYLFIGFLGSVQIGDSQEIKLAEFLTAEGVLRAEGNKTFRISSAFMDELMRRRVISDLYKSCPESAIPEKDDGSLDILNILQTAIQFFDKNVISNGFTRSFKVADELYVGGKKKKKVPRESVYDTELNRILVNWLVKGGGYEVTGQWHMVENRDGKKDKHSYSDIVITTDCQKIVLELLATATKNNLDEHFERVLKYAELLSASDIWIVHFTCEDGYATQKLQWPPDDRINVVHIFHDRKLNVLMNARYADSDGTIEYIVDQAVPLRY